MLAAAGVFSGAGARCDEQPRRTARAIPAIDRDMLHPPLRARSARLVRIVLDAQDGAPGAEAALALEDDAPHALVEVGGPPAVGAEVPGDPGLAGGIGLLVR